MSVFDGLPDIFTETFGRAVTIRATGVPDQIVQGIFQARSVDAFGVSQPEAMLHLRAADAALLTQSATVEIGGAWFIPRVQEADGKGMVPVRLEKTTPPA